MARTGPYGLCGQMCQEWWSHSSAESSQTTVEEDFSRLSSVTWVMCLPRSSKNSNRRCWWLPDGFRCNRHEQICLRQWDILGCLPVCCCCTRRLRCHRKVVWHRISYYHYYNYHQHHLNTAFQLSIRGNTHGVVLFKFQTESQRATGIFDGVDIKTRQVNVAVVNDVKHMKLGVESNGSVLLTEHPHDAATRLRTSVCLLPVTQTWIYGTCVCKDRSCSCAANVGWQFGRCATPWNVMTTWAAMTNYTNIARFNTQNILRTVIAATS